MLARILLLITSFALAPLVSAAPIDCKSKSTFLRKIPGGHEVVFHCGCEPPVRTANHAPSCGYPEPKESTSERGNPGLEMPTRPLQAVRAPITYIVPSDRVPVVTYVIPGNGTPFMGIDDIYTCDDCEDEEAEARTVYVRQYYRGDGTYVRPHMRAAPRSRR